ncbi:putative membrane protein [Mycobacterium marinum str. Europe]|nr:putative membrane protein [Mycobacterium marinum str. Europe]
MAPAPAAAPPRQYAPPPPARPAPHGPPAPTPAAAPVSPPRRPAESTESGWIGKLLAVAGVAVTLTGVALLLVLAAQAGLLRPEIRVAGGTALSLALVGVAVRLRGRPGGRIGAIALAATGIATAYLDVIAATTIYQWVPAPAGLVLAALVGGAGLALARRWDSEHLGLLVLVPLIGLAPVLTRGADLLLVSFMLALSAAALPVQLGKDWVWLHAARVAAPTVPLLIALVAAGKHDNTWLLGAACGVAAILAIVSGLIVLPGGKNAAALAVLTVVGTLPVLAAAVAVDRVFAALLAGTLAAALLAIVLVGSELPTIFTRVLAAWSAISALVAVTVAFDGHVEGPILLALAIVVAVAGRHDRIALWAAAGFGIVGLGLHYSYAPLHALLTATVMPTSIAVSTLAASLLSIAFVVAMSRACAGIGGQNRDIRRILAAVGGVLVIYAVTAFTVTAGVLIAGTEAGFLAGHMAATICWIAVAAAQFVYALRVADRERRTAPISAGLALTGAATAKLFLFDLATLDGIFRVAAFIVVGLVLLAMGTGYARSLAR